MNFTFTLHGEVQDVERLYSAALEQSTKDGMNKDEADEMLTTDGDINVTACIRTLLDPGVSPDGLSIDDSDCETSNE